MHSDQCIECFVVQVACAVIFWGKQQYNTVNSGLQISI